MKTTVASVLALLVVFIPAHSPAAEQTVVNARQLSAGSPNIVPADPRWSSLSVCYGPSGFQQWTAEVKHGGKYFVHFCYASGEKRPCRLSINGKPQGSVLGEPTGGFFAEQLAWKTLGPYDLVEGANTIRLEASSNMPHFRGLVVSTDKKIAGRSVFGQKIVDAAAAQESEIQTMTATRRKLQLLLPGVKKILFVRRYTFQSSHYYTDFIDGCRHFGGNLCLLSLDDGTVEELCPELAGGIFGRCDLSFDGRRIVFGYKRQLGEGFRIWQIGIDGKGLRQLTFPPEDEDARIDKYRLKWHWGYMHHTDDMHPCYLPDGGICFISTRCEFGILCDARDILTGSVLYRMDGDGRNMEKLSHSAVSESAPSIMNDGRILYTRWEYVDKGAVSEKALWAVRPDGTGSVEVYGIDIAFPDTFNVGRAIAGSNDLFVCIGGPHMPVGLGSVLRIDTTRDLRTTDPITYITPETDVQQEWGWNHPTAGARSPAGRSSNGPLFMDPYPLSRRQFLVSYNPRSAWNDKKAYALYLLEEGGAKDLLYRDAEFSCWNAIPVRARSKPPVLHSNPDPELAKQGLAHAIVIDVYRGLDNVKRGTIKYIRINEQMPRPWSTRRFWDGDIFDQQHSVISRNAHLGLKIQHGIVPVEADGSASFLVPADKNIFFQALDENYREVQRERTFIDYRPGETRSCVGCHEKAKDNPATCSRLPLALGRSPSTPGPQPGETTGARPLHYPADVQPILDKHCVRCHNEQQKDSKLVLTGELTRHFNRSYENILSARLIPIIGENHPKTGNIHYLPPYSLGSHASRLIEIVERGCPGSDAKLSREEMIRLTTWVDSNGQYYGTYHGRKNIAFKGHPNFRPTPTFETAANPVPPLPDEQR